MPEKVVEDGQAATTQLFRDVTRPVDRRTVIIRRISVTTSGALLFGRWIAFLYRGTEPLRIPICRKILPDTHTYPATIFEGSSEWPLGTSLALRGMTQELPNTASWTIWYEFVEPARRRWW